MRRPLPIPAVLLCLEAQRQLPVELVDVVLHHPLRQFVGTEEIIGDQQGIDLVGFINIVAGAAFLDIYQLCQFGRLVLDRNVVVFKV